MAAIVRLFVDSLRLIAQSQNRTKCLKYVWLSYSTWPSRWVLCISMQWMRLKGCHVACDEWTSGEICSLQHMWVISSVMWAAASDESLKFGVQGATATNWFPRVNGMQDNRIWLYWESIILHNAMYEVKISTLWTEYSGIFGQYHACWCPGNLSCQDIHRHSVYSTCIG